MTQEGDNCLYSQKGTTGPILINPFRDSTVEKTISEIKNVVNVSSNLNDYENKIQKIRGSSSLAQEGYKLRKKIKHGQLQFEPRYAHYAAALYAKNASKADNINHYLEHIYESIDNDSIGSRIYDQKIFYSRNVPSSQQMSKLYGISNLQEDEWSQNSSSSYGPIYDKKPLLFDSSNINNSSNHLNNSLFDNNIDASISGKTNEAIIQKEVKAMDNVERVKVKKTKSLASSSKILNHHQLTQNVTNNDCNVNSSNSELPDLIQYQCDNNLEGFGTEKEKIEQKMTILQSNMDKSGSIKCMKMNVPTHPKMGTYC